MLIQRQDFHLIDINQTDSISWQWVTPETTIFEVTLRFDTIDNSGGQITTNHVLVLGEAGQTGNDGTIMTYNIRSLLREIDRMLSTNSKLTLSQVEQELGIERHTVERALRELTGFSYRAYRRKKLAKKAALLLLTTTLENKELAAMLGFGSESTFSRFIRQTTGKTPTEIRQTNLNGETEDMFR